MALLQYRKVVLNLSKVSGVLQYDCLLKLAREKWTLSKDLFKFSEDVAAAVKLGKPVVALESTIITHGMPYPANLKTAIAVEDIVTNQGAVPATIAIMNGKICVGMNKTELKELAETRGTYKTSRRDLPYVLSKRLTGGTTVAGTMVIAHQAGIPVFVTGGIGGVHRGSEKSMDVSADLTELSRTPLTVVSGGVKSILDIEKTLEYLETLGVSVVTYGPSRNFPAFFAPDSGFLAPYNVTTPEEAAKLIIARDELKLQSGILLAVPISQEHSAEGEMVETAIKEALRIAEQNRICGKDITPFILSKVNELTDGTSLQANIALVKSNACVGAQVAVELTKLHQQNEELLLSDRCVGFSSNSVETEAESVVVQEELDIGRPVVVGGSVVDFTATVLEEKLQLAGRFNVGRIDFSFGGVGRNMADALARLDHNPLFISAIGKDSHGSALLQYNSKLARQFEETLKEAPLMIFDGNIPVPTMEYLLCLCHEHKIPAWFEPTDIHTAGKPFLLPNDMWKVLTYASPNINELRVMHRALSDRIINETNSTDYDTMFKECVQLSLPFLEHMHTLVVTLGNKGMLLVTTLEDGNNFPVRQHPSVIKKGNVRAIFYPPIVPEKVVSVVGAGDCLASGIISGMLRKQNVLTCIQDGIQAAAMSLVSHHAVPQNLSRDGIRNFVKPPLGTWNPKVIY
ncbi:uncharacterized protein LOC143223603 isoform X2 [Tachypleus tridentatus]|uniref:uncharacterized protein LOC143223603 isoform X2 n=1 Tax=Tachypleus tridentatus TaxID=6853 RepID=UPI003FCF1EE5